MDNLGFDDTMNNGNGVPPQNDFSSPRDAGSVDANDNAGIESGTNESRYTRQPFSDYGSHSAEAMQSGHNSTSQHTVTSTRAASLYPATNLPPEGQNSSGDLSKEEMQYLRKIGEQNFVIKKKIKKLKQAYPMEDARILSRVRRLYSLQFVRRYFGFPPHQVKKLRDRMGDDNRSRFGAAAQRTKKMILTMVIIVAILATLGTGSVVAIMAINNSVTSNFASEGLIIVNAEEISKTPINGYVLGKKLDFGVYIKNSTNKPVNVCFYIDTVPGAALQDAIDRNLVDPSQLMFTYYYDESKWQLDAATGKLYYIENNGVYEITDAATPALQVISGFSLDIATGQESNKWINYSLTLEFCVEYQPAA